MRAFAPGRVNLIGEYTDVAGGSVLPVAVHLGTTVTLEPGGDRIVLASAEEPEPADVALDGGDPAVATPAWARYVAGVAAEVHPAVGGRGTVATTLPVGAGLSSSAALEVAVALALGFEGPPTELALACQRAEQRASGVPCGVMDQMASVHGVAGHALLVDCTTLAVEPVALPEGLDVVAVHSGQPRALAGSAYAARRAACDRAAEVVGPLRDAAPADVEGIAEPEARRRARHVVTEEARVHAFVAALRADDRPTLGALLAEGHRSLRDDFEVSTPTIDALVERLATTPGVVGARLTGAGFGGCVLALCERGALDEGWVLRAVDGARRLDADRP
ncbi:galactokinase [Iamia majanohamensis]|uniref:Galactokinase n=1 Tax=Iamia majanohamensis TaxID=467976 RepID=A0AAE9Y5U0_9ACTN|nr:galactokinase [Iamia majanohamensis]WCO66046.1 galactokinase [Iamia majanohamensis]